MPVQFPNSCDIRPTELVVISLVYEKPVDSVYSCICDQPRFHGLLRLGERYTYFKKTLSERTANGSCRMEIARPKGTVVSMFGMQKQCVFRVALD